MLLTNVLLLNTLTMLLRTPMRHPVFVSLETRPPIRVSFRAPDSSIQKGCSSAYDVMIHFSRVNLYSCVNLFKLTTAHIQWPNDAEQRTKWNSFRWYPLNRRFPPFMSGLVISALLVGRSLFNCRYNLFNNLSISLNQ